MSRWEPRRPVAVAAVISAALALAGCQSTAGAADSKQVCGTHINSPAEMTGPVWYEQLSPSASSVTIKDGGSLWVILTTDCAHGFQVSNGSGAYQVIGNVPAKGTAGVVAVDLQARSTGTEAMVLRDKTGSRSVEVNASK
ncbi:hypothetical protein AZH51_14215 [Branchiibius sp. NY16-3462-2]|nr:hypothetical protein AZH51_14215 [Branchiibius sp. NY16-3462-2]